MVFMTDMPSATYDRIVNQELPEFGETKCVAGPPISDRRVAIVTTAGLHRRQDKAFALGVGEYRIIPNDTDMNDLIMSHISNNFDRTGFQQDLNVVFPIDRLQELADRKVIGKVSDQHLSYAGNQFDLSSIRLDSGPAGAQFLKEQGVDVVLLTPV